MKTPHRIRPLVEDGLVDEVVRRLMSGKEADVFVVRSGDRLLCAKVYKDASKRSFKKAVQYQEGRRVRSGRRARAMGKGSKFGRSQQEDTWQNAEVDALQRLASSGVRVPQSYGCMEGVLLMELIVGPDGDVAPRLADVSMTREEAIEGHTLVMEFVKRMLCAGLVHGDLSEFNVLVDEHGPVIIDLPQAVDASSNNNAEAMLLRDVQNITTSYAEFAPELLKTRYASEMWDLYEQGALTEQTALTGNFEEDNAPADVDGVLAEIQAVIAEEEAHQEQLRGANPSGWSGADKTESGDSLNEQG